MSERMAATPAPGELRRSRSNRMLAGVAGGGGGHLALPPLALLAVVVLAILSEVPVWPQGDAWLFLLAAGALVLWLTWYAVGTARSGWLRGLGILLATLAVVLLLFVAGFFAAFDVDLGKGVDERTYAPATAGELRDRYELGLGELAFDLRSVSFPPGVTTLDVRVDLGS